GRPAVDQGGSQRLTGQVRADGPMRNRWRDRPSWVTPLLIPGGTSMTGQHVAPSPTERDTRLPRALSPFRHPAYRRLGLALFLSLLTGGLWIVALVWEVIRLDGGPAQLSF